MQRGKILHFAFIKYTVLRLMYECESAVCEDGGALTGGHQAQLSCIFFKPS